MKLKVQSSRFKVQIKKLLLLSVFLLFAIHYSPFTDIAFASEKWKGVDESVVEKFAKEYGREARDPLINTDQGTCCFLSSFWQGQSADSQPVITGMSS